MSDQPRSVFEWNQKLADSAYIATAGRVEMGLIIQIIRSENKKHGHEAWPSNATLARKLGTSIRSIERARKKLRDAGFIEILDNVGGRGKGVTMRLSLPANPDTADGVYEGETLTPTSLNPDKSRPETLTKPRIAYKEEPPREPPKEQQGGNAAAAGCERKGIQDRMPVAFARLKLEGINRPKVFDELLTMLEKAALAEGVDPSEVDKVAKSAIGRSCLSINGVETKPGLAVEFIRDIGAAKVRIIAAENRRDRDRCQAEAATALNGTRRPAKPPDPIDSARHAKRFDDFADPYAERQGVKAEPLFAVA